MHLVYHSPDSRSILFLDDFTDAVQTERLKSALLVNGVTDFALDLLDFDSSHLVSSLSSKYFLHGNAPVAGDRVSVADLAERLDSSLDEVVGVR